MNIDFSHMKTAAQLQADKYEGDLEIVRAARRAAYQSESDPLRLEIAYDALNEGLNPDFTAWVASVAAIKARYPLPDQPVD